MQIYKTPRGKVMWAKVVTPDTKFDVNGTYSVNMTLKADDPATQEMCALLDQAVQDKVSKEMEFKPERFKSLPAGAPLTAPPYTEENGEVTFKFKLKAKVTTKTGESYTQRPIVVDSKGSNVLRVAEDGRVMNNSFSVGNGSVCAVHYQQVPYFVASTKQCGVSLRLKALQVFKLEKFGNGGLDFEEQDGFSYEDADLDYGNSKETPAPQSAGNEDGDF